MIHVCAFCSGSGLYLRCALAQPLGNACDQWVMHQLRLLNLLAALLLEQCHTVRAAQWAVGSHMHINRQGPADQSLVGPVGMGLNLQQYKQI